jgi:hypothetical protein
VIEPGSNICGKYLKTVGQVVAEKSAKAGASIVDSFEKIAPHRTIEDQTRAQWANAFGHVNLGAF